MNFIAKDVPLVIATVKHELQQGKGYFGTKYLASSVRQQQIIVVLMSITN